MLDGLGFRVLKGTPKVQKVSGSSCHESDGHNTIIEVPACFQSFCFRICAMLHAVPKTRSRVLSVFSVTPVLLHEL